MAASYVANKVSLKVPAHLEIHFVDGSAYVRVYVLIRGFHWSNDTYRYSLRSCVKLWGVLSVMDIRSINNVKKIISVLFVLIR